jgi:hypothetical protein
VAQGVTKSVDSFSSDFEVMVDGLVAGADRLTAEGRVREQVVNMADRNAPEKR